MNGVIKSPYLKSVLGGLMLLPSVGCTSSPPPSSSSNPIIVAAPSPVTAAPTKPVRTKPKAKPVTPTALPLKVATTPIENDAYVLVKDLSSEDAGSFKIRWQVIAKDTSSKEKLAQLADKLTALALAKVPPSESRPVVLDLKIYADQAHLKNAQQWVAWVFKSGVDTLPTTTYDDAQIGTKEKVSTKKFGLTEEQRKAIFTEIVQAEDRGRREAIETFPEDYSTGTDVDFEKRDKLEEKLGAKYKREVAKQHGLKYRRIEEIANEGLNNSWPLP